MDLRTVKPLVARQDSAARKLRMSRRWREKTRPQKLARDPLCQRCKFLGFVTTATDVDHWVRLADGGAEHDDDNLVALCVPHHEEKDALEQRGEELFAIAPSTPRTVVIA